MTIDAAPLRAALRSVHPGTLSVTEAETVVALAQLAVDADGQEDADEIRMFFAIGKAVFELAGIADAPTPTFAVDEDDDVRIASLASQLRTQASRELAYAVAHLLTVVDVEIAPAEDELLSHLRSALQLDDDRADELAAQLSAAITPAE
jgi:hypothetical protein